METFPVCIVFILISYTKLLKCQTTNITYDHSVVDFSTDGQLFDGQATTDQTTLRSDTIAVKNLTSSNTKTLQHSTSNVITTNYHTSIPAEKSSTLNVDSSINSECLSTVDLAQTRFQLKTLLDDGNKLIFMQFILLNSTLTNNQPLQNETYQPFNFVYTTSKYGQRLLLLRSTFQLLSLGSLSYDIESLTIQMRENDPNCLNRTSSRTLQNSLRKMILSKFQTETNNKVLNSQGKVCNLKIGSDAGKAKFRYTCCSQDRNSVIKCQEEKEDLLIKSLHVIIFILQILAFLFSPLLVPKHWYRSKTSVSEYVLNLKQPLELRAMKVGEHYLLGAGKWVRLSKIRLGVKVHKLVSATRTPIGILETLYKNFVLCEIRQELVLKDCCFGNVCGNCKASFCEFKWFRCCRMFVQFIYIFALLIPVIFWLIEFYLFEYDNYQSRLLASESRGLSYSYDGSITSLPLSHSIFTSALIILLTVLVIFSIIKSISKCFDTTIYQSTVSLFKKSFLAMREDRISRRNIYRGAFISIIWPFQRYGIFALIFVLIYWCLAIPIISLIVISTIIPVLNLIFRILGWTLNALSAKFSNSFYSFLQMVLLKLKIKRSIFFTTPTDPEYQREKYLFTRILKAFYALINLTVLFLGLLVLLECTGFYVIILVYSAIGMIVNISKTLKFIILFLMIVLHARDCFSGISDIYTNFGQKLIETLLNFCKEDVDFTTIATSNYQVNTAFQVPSICNDDQCSVEFHQADNGDIKFKIKRTPLFVNNRDIPYMTEKFFFDACYMGYSGCPGPLLPHFLKALWHLLTIMFFLFLIIFILLIFGDETISSVNQTLITLVGGLLPFVFRSVLFQRRKYYDFDINNLNFKNGLKNMIENFVQVFPASKTFVLSEDLYEIPDADTENETLPISNDEHEFELHDLNYLSAKSEEAIIDMSEDEV